MAKWKRISMVEYIFPAFKMKKIFTHATLWVALQMTCRQNDVVIQGQVFSSTYVEYSEEADVEAERKSVVVRG